MESVFRVIHSCTKHTAKGLINKTSGANILNNIQRRATFSSLGKEIATFRPRRSLLFVPADDRKKINKATNLQADCIILECEDGVAMSQKVCWKISLVKCCSINFVLGHGHQVSWLFVKNQFLHSKLIKLL